MIVGSLIKNPGGGLAPVGGYIVGTEDCIGTGGLPPDFSGPWKRGGRNAWASISPSYQGLFLAPTVTAGALKGAIFAANLYEMLGFPSGSQRQREPSRYHSGRYLRKGRGRHRVLQGHSGGCSGGQLCDAGTLGNAGL